MLAAPKSGSRWNGRRRVDPVAEAALKAVAVEQGEKELEVLLL